MHTERVWWRKGPGLNADNHGDFTLRVRWPCSWTNFLSSPGLFYGLRTTIGKECHGQGETQAPSKLLPSLIIPFIDQFDNSSFAYNLLRIVKIYRGDSSWVKKKKIFRRIQPSFERFNFGLPKIHWFRLSGACLKDRIKWHWLTWEYDTTKRFKAITISKLNKCSLECNLIMYTYSSNVLYAILYTSEQTLFFISLRLVFVLIKLTL